MRGDKKLQPSATPTTVAVRLGERLVTDGLFVEAREQWGGFFVLECAGMGGAVTGGRALTRLVGLLGDLDLAEEAIAACRPSVVGLRPGPKSIRLPG
ncbi:hypothetical protein [Streptomyces collinus]|uniref:hypothetical protein n=1 Tax=Streptomyces collinus TaxID=42684 RepID=UPI0036764E85